MNKDKLHNALFSIDSVGLQVALEPLLLQVENETLSFSEALSFITKNTSLSPSKFLKFATELSKCLVNYEIVVQETEAGSQESGSASIQELVTDNLQLTTNQEINKSRNQAINESSNQVIKKSINQENTLESVISSIATSPSKQLISVAESFVKGTRNELEAFEALTREKEKGGEGLDNATAQKLMNALHEVKDAYHKTPVVRKVSEIHKVIQDLDIDVKGVQPLPHTFIDQKDNYHPKIEDFVEHIKYHNDIITGTKELGSGAQKSEVRRLKSGKENEQMSKLANEQVEKSAIASAPKLITDNLQLSTNQEINKSSNQEINKSSNQEIKKSSNQEINKLIEADIQNHQVTVGALADLAVPTIADAPVVKKPGFFAKLFRKKSATVPSPKLITDNLQLSTNQQINKSRNQENNLTPSSSSTPLTRANLRPKLQDVIASELDTPVSELGRLTVTDFRRLDKDPQKACEKLVQKLDVLALDSLLQKDAGINALFASPLYKAYADILQLSITQGKTFISAIETKKTLTQPEFEAIMALNGNLSRRI